MIKQLKGTTKLIKLSAFAISLVSCSTISYVPIVSPEVSPATINKSVQVDKLKDSSPAKDKKNPFMGLSVTNEESLPGGLDLQVTNAIAADFSESRLFKQVGRKLENPDFIIKGEIKKFTGKSRANHFTKVSWFMATASLIAAVIAKKSIFLLGALPMISLNFGIPVAKNTSEIEIELSLYDKNNNLINTYTGQATDLISTSIYYNQALAIPAMTNRTFSRGILQIREKILKDTDKLKGN